MTSNIIYVPKVFPVSLRLRIRLWRASSFMMSMAPGLPADYPVGLEEEFKALIAKENVNITKICFSYATSVDEMNDMRQDALINIWRGMKTFRGEASGRTWIYRITINSCLSAIKKQKRHRHEDLSQLYDLIDTDCDRREEIEKMHGVISRLNGEDKAIIMMWLDEIGYDDIAETVGLNRNTVATRIRRIKEKIKNNYQKEQ